ncbi:MAG: type IV secretion protein Rhs [Magnetococcales bacterium]|nr:type IV secretion protein Rhs [Magnetococcales bacterium]
MALAGIINPVLPFLIWYNTVRNNLAGRENSWDYKQLGKQYEAGGNANYGVTGSALGIPPQILLRGAGWAQERSGNYDPNNGHWWGEHPYGDARDDQKNIQKGIDFFYGRKKR